MRRRVLGDRRRARPRSRPVERTGVRQLRRRQVGPGERETGAVVDWEPSTSLAETLADHLAAGDPPEIAILPNLALMDQLADEEVLVPLDPILDTGAIRRDYAPAWIDLGSHAGTLYGIFSKVTSKATVWYAPKAFAAAGYAVPATWDEMIALADRIVTDGVNPFSIVAAQGPANGWALTDWISEIVLNACGADLYDQWIAGEIPWTQPCIRGSFERFLGIVSTTGFVLGGSDADRRDRRRRRRRPALHRAADRLPVPVRVVRPGVHRRELPRPRAGARLRRLPVPRHRSPLPRRRHRRRRCPGPGPRHPGRSVPHRLSGECPGPGGVDQARRLHLGEPRCVCRCLPGSGRPPRAQEAATVAGSVPGT